ncbi:unnamed protein product [Periconia digitata]|uniref:Ankyrin repeat domain-containing protein n=1 Tax=Periconia digitata TaxID=1303443 RepID=A0A9W4UNE6_9PLEO|nr:unnamed protein product [Periconia digitata]
MASKEREILAACTSGQMCALEKIFKELNMGPDHPKTPYSIDKNIPDDQRPVSVEDMLMAAIEGKQVETITFLCKTFPDSHFYGAPMRAAIQTGDVQVLREVCKQDPSVASQEMGDDETVNALGYAASRPNGDGLIKVLLDSGANPNEPPPFPMPSCWNVSAAVVGGLPTSTFEQFFDAGFSCNDPHVARLAVEKKRPDVLEVLFARGKNIPGAYFPPKEDLIKAANETNNSEIVANINQLYAEHQAKPKKGLLTNLMDKFRS